MGAFANRVLVWVLSSPLRRLAGRSLTAIRLIGRRTGATHVFPVQYAADGDRIVIVAANASDKTWWRNLEDGGTADLLLDGDWIPHHLRVVRGDERSRAYTDYLARFPKLADRLDDCQVVVAART
ncbi:MAG: nitroreductase/quinone reductase family protein [Actinomycetota bacterium]